MDLRQRVEKIDKLGFKALNSFKTSFNELYSLAFYLKLDYIKAKGGYYLCYQDTPKIAFKSKDKKVIKAYLCELLKQKNEARDKREAKKADAQRLQAIKDEKHAQKIRDYNKGGLFDLNDLAS